MLTCQHAEDALTCCPPGYANIYTFVHCGQAAGIWTFTIIAIVEVMTAMVFMVPKVYYEIKEKGKREGIVKGRADVLAAMRDAGIDDETRRRVEAIARRNDN